MQMIWMRNTNVINPLKGHHQSQVKLLKIKLFMKVVKKVIYVAMASFCLNLTVSSQNITLKMSNITVKQAMDELKSRSGYSFVFSSADVDTGKKISVSSENQSINAVIEQILRGQGLTYEIQGKNIILKKDILTSVDKKTKITGIVKDQYGEPIIGANVVVKGTTVGTITDIDGNYTLDVPSGASLQVSYIGYLTQDVVTAGKNNIDINLIEDTQKLEEVVVVGYGTQRKGELTSSISSVKSEDFIQGSVQDAAQLLQGKVAGLGVVLSDGDPASSTQIMLRGVGSIATGASPLVIIDDVPGELNMVAPEDIASIDVVKDGSAAAIYGTRGNNGVIFITTKKVRGEIPVTVDVHAYMTTQHIKKKLNMMDASQYRELVKQGKPGAVDYGYDTDWMDEIMQTPFSWVTNASLKGGTTKSNYIANINYKSAEGIIKRSKNDVLTTRIEVNHSMWDDLLKFNLNLLGIDIRQIAGPLGQHDNGVVGNLSIAAAHRKRVVDRAHHLVTHAHVTVRDGTDLVRVLGKDAALAVRRGHDRKGSLALIGTMFRTYDTDEHGLLLPHLGGALTQLAAADNNVLAFQALGLGENVLRRILIEHQLQNAGGIAQVGKDDAALVAGAGDGAADSHFLTGHGKRDFAAIVCAAQTAQSFHISCPLYGFIFY